jgi:hypothetical protein
MAKEMCLHHQLSILHPRFSSIARAPTTLPQHFSQVRHNFPHPMANTFVLILVIFGVYSFGLCVCSQTLQTSTNLDLFMACPIIEEISKSGSPKTYIS